ncbi:unnamed protein product [Amoebophrya sp. A120]|nr:unnamed protein product [Amoebophrya sp. A120]|eukprot:GSA120T00017326001.1
MRHKAGPGSCGQGGVWKCIFVSPLLTSVLVNFREAHGVQLRTKPPREYDYGTYDHDLEVSPGAASSLAIGFFRDAVWSRYEGVASDSGPTAAAQLLHRENVMLHEGADPQLPSSENKLDPPLDATSSFLAVFYSHTCPDCRNFRPVWNRLRGEVPQNLTLVAVEDPEYAAPGPFRHFEIPAVFRVEVAKSRVLAADTPTTTIGAGNFDGTTTRSRAEDRHSLKVKVTKFPMAALGDFLEHKKSADRMLAELVGFVSPSVTAYGLSKRNDGRRGKETKGTDGDAGTLLAVLAAHPGQELGVLHSPDFRDTALAIRGKDALPPEVCFTQKEVFNDEQKLLRLCCMKGEMPPSFTRRVYAALAGRFCMYRYALLRIASVCC